MLDTLKNNGHAAYAGSGKSPYGDALFHSARVRRLKILLPVAALIIAAGLTAVALVRIYLPENIKMEGVKMENGKVVMEKPAIAGRNSDGINYSMLAERALQDIRNPDLITLETIKAAVPMNDGLIARVVASTADYNRATDNLHMTAPFTLVLSSGLNAQFQSAHLDIKGGNMRSDDPVTITKDNASIVAKTMEITDKGRMITFEGNVRMNVDPSTIHKQGT